MPMVVLNSRPRPKVNTKKMVWESGFAEKLSELKSFGASLQEDSL